MICPFKKIILTIDYYTFYLSRARSKLCGVEDTAKK
jgi:hypothetical protein